jgi:hypothetical protein
MKTRSQTITYSSSFSVKEVEAAKALMQLKKACTAKPVAKPVAKPAAKNTWPSGRPRRSTAGYVNYAETD